MIAAAEINQSERDGTTVVTILGELDPASAYRLITALARTITRDQPTVLDLTGVGHMDGTGLQILTAASRLATQQHARLTIVPSPAVTRVLDLNPHDTLARNAIRTSRAHPLRARAWRASPLSSARR